MTYLTSMFEQISIKRFGLFFKIGKLKDFPSILVASGVSFREGMSFIMIEPNASDSLNKFKGRFASFIDFGEVTLGAYRSFVVIRSVLISFLDEPTVFLTVVFDGHVDTSTSSDMTSVRIPSTLEVTKASKFLYGN